MVQYYILQIFGEEWTTTYGLHAETIQEAVAKALQGYQQLWATGQPTEKIGIRVYDKHGQEVSLEFPPELRDE